MEHLPKKIHHNGISYTLVGDSPSCRGGLFL